MNIKALKERKNTLISELEALNAACAERIDKSFSEEELNDYNSKMEEIKNINSILERADTLKNQVEDLGHQKRSKEEKDDPDLAIYVRTAVQEGLDSALQRANMTKGANGVVIPTTISQKIIDKLENICPIFEKATKFNFKGKVVFPVIDESEDAVIVDYADEFGTLTSHVHKFDHVDLEGFLYATLVVISKSLINNAAVDIEAVIINKIAYALKKFLEHECLIGTSSKMTGALSSANIIKSSAKGVITADDLIDTQNGVIDTLQEGCEWYMHPTTLATISKMKDSEGRYLLNNDITTGFKKMLLGKPVNVSDAMPVIEDNAKAVLYCDASGLYLNMGEAFEIQVLIEKYAEQHAIGINAWGETDCDIVEPQKFAVLQVNNA